MLELCMVLGDVAEGVMSARQELVPMSVLVEMVPSDDLVEEIIHAIVIDAYGRPAFSVPDNQRRAVMEFRSEIEHACYSAL